MRIRVPPLFRIWYSSTYTVLFGILLVFLAVTPGDTIYQSIRTGEIQKLFIIGGVYCLTLIIAILVYSTRLYTNRTVLQAIPKPYIPIEDGEVGKLVRRMIVKALRRSAIIAWDSRPRDLSGEVECEEEAERRGHSTGGNSFSFRRRSHGCSATVIPVSTKSPPWGHVSHPGWGSPSSVDLANLQYWKVITELPNLIEAKAVSLAPPDPAVEDNLQVEQDTPPLPDAQVVALLQRPPTMGVRQYLGRLTSYGLINPPELATKFVTQYEYARFSTHALSEQEFRNLMSLFAQILNSMTMLDPDLIEEARQATQWSESGSFVSSSATSSTVSTSNLPYQTPRMQSSAYGSGFGIMSQSHGGETPQTMRTAPSMPRNNSSYFYSMPRTPSVATFGSGSVRIRRVPRSPSTVFPNSSSSSLGSTHSVIRLHPDPQEGEEPYQYNLDGR